MAEVLSLWRSPLDQVALAGAVALSIRQPHCSVPSYEDFSAMTIYNYGYYVHTLTFEAALTAMLGDMDPSSQGAIGGAAFIPQSNFPIDASMGPFNVPDQCNIVASGGGGPGTGAFYHFTIDFSVGSTFFSCASTYTAGGTCFHGLAFQGTNWGGAGVTCISAGTGNCRAIRCTFTNCPQAFNAQAPGCSLERCTIAYLSIHAPNGATAVAIAASQCTVVGPGEFLQTSPHPGMGGHGPTSCTCISVQGGADHTVIADIHLSDWSTGVDFSKGGGSTFTHIRNCEIQSYLTALNIQVGGDGAPITGVKVTSSTLARTYHSDQSSNSSPVILIDPGGSGNSQLTDITLLDCTVFNKGNALSLMSQHGLEIVGGKNIKILGGTYSNNSPNAGAGIAITGMCDEVQIIGANLQPSYDDGTGVSVTQNQQFALLVSATPAGTVLVSGCDMRGYGSAPPVSISTGMSNLFIYDCLGYNDQSTLLNGPMPPTSPTNNAASCSTPYFGPSVITFWNASPVTLHIFGLTLTLSFGVVFVPSPYDVFYFSGATLPSNFSWHGK